MHTYAQIRAYTYPHGAPLPVQRTESAMEIRVRDPKTAKLTDLPHCLWVQKATHGTGPAGNPSRKTRLSEGDSQKIWRAARAGEKKGDLLGGGPIFGYPPKKRFAPLSRQ